MKLNLSLQKQICLYIVGFTIITTGTVAYFLHKQLNSYTRIVINSSLLSNTALAALKVDTALHNSIRFKKDEGGDSYLKIKKDLQQIRDAVKNIRYVYTMRKGINGEIRFVVDAEEKPEEIAHVNDIYNDASELLKSNFVTMTHPMIEKEFYTDKWGTWFTAYAPIYSPDGKRCGILGMDISAQSMKAENRKILLITLLVFICTTIPFCILGWIFGNRLTLPLINLKKTLADNFSENRFDNLIKISGRNEITELAEDFNTMAVKLKDTITSLKAEIAMREKTEAQLKKAYINTMKVIVKILAEHESSTAEHSIRVPTLSLILADEMGITDKEELENIQYGALLHDIGKISVLRSILQKTSKLTVEEKDKIKEHPKTGYDIVNTVPNLYGTANIVLSHHERYDGKGYPRGLSGDDICIGARVFAVIDAFDAIISDRHYRKCRSTEDAIKEINKCSGIQFDPKVVTAFNNCYLKFKPLYNKLKFDNNK